jgi:lactate dehydrogenase-like 2-hydroxyacid dehydrogenase
MSARVVVTRRIFPELIHELKARYTVGDNQDDAAWTSTQLAARLRDADGALITAGDRIDDALLDACPRLRAVSNIAVGFNNIDLAACTRRGVAATNTPDVLNEATADHAWALLLAAARTRRLRRRANGARRLARTAERHTDAAHCFQYPRHARSDGAAGHAQPRRRPGRASPRGAPESRRVGN